MEPTSDSKNLEKKNQKIKADIQECFDFLSSKYSEDEDSLKDIKHIFLNCIPPLWRVDKK